MFLKYGCGEPVTYDMFVSNPYSIAAGKGNAGREVKDGNKDPVSKMIRKAGFEYIDKRPSCACL